MNTVDFELPSRRMPIQFERHYGGQDLYHGPFGRGWDFNYNQRLGELEGGIFAPGMKMPLVVRGNSSDEIGQAKDIILQMGDGRIALFAFMSNSPPTEYSQDELVKDLRWDVSGVGFYRPPEGLFDLLVRFGDGKYGRLTPEGTRYWYSRNGKLEKIEDRYTNNVIQLEYNQRGELRKIIDRSVSERYLELGYYRAPGDSEAGTPDKTASRSAEIGLICALRDKIGSAPRREVNFTYDECGRMTKREGVNITSGHNRAFTGRELTTYVHTSRSKVCFDNGMKGWLKLTGGSPFSATGPKEGKFRGPPERGIPSIVCVE